MDKPTNMIPGAIDSWTEKIMKADTMAVAHNAIRTSKCTMLAKKSSSGSVVIAKKCYLDMDIY